MANSFWYCAILLILAGIVQGQNTSVVPHHYPLYKQCDPRWTDDLMNTKTICQVGCLMSSTAMGLAGSHVPILQLNDTKYIRSDPKTLNLWLKNNNGYDGSNDLIETAVPNINPDRVFWLDDAFHKTNDLSFATVTSYLDSGRIVIANVHNGGHFVLLVGYSTEDGDTFIVNDPGFNVSTYSYSKDVVGYRIFDMKKIFE